MLYGCVHCSERSQLVDMRHGDIYSFACSTLAKGSLLVGERAANDIFCDSDTEKVSPEEVRASYGLMPNQVTQNLYRNMNRKYY